MMVLFPVTLLFEQITKGIEKAFKVKEETTFDEEDFENVVEKVSDEGILEEEQSDIIQSALDFADTNVKEVLTPRNKIFALNIRELDKEKLHEIIIKTNYKKNYTRLLLKPITQEFQSTMEVLITSLVF